MKKVTILIIFLIITALQLNCGILPSHTKSKQKLPIDKELSIIGYVINANQDLYLALHDPIDIINYTSHEIKPDSIICIIDSNAKGPTLEIREKYVQRTEYRYYNHQEHSKDSSQPQHAVPGNH